MNVGQIEYTIDADTAPYLKKNDEVKKANDNLGKSFNELDKQVDKYGNELRQVDREMGRFIDKSGRMREKNGQFVKGLQKSTSSINTNATAMFNLNQVSLRVSAALGPAGAMAAGLAASTTATLAFTAATTAAIKEIDVLAQRANTNTSNFQAWSYAASTVNVSMQELSDVFKDMNDRMGEFTGEGTGELEHAFNKFLKPAGMTVETLREMAGQDALQAIIKGMQEGGASANEMTAVLEQVSSNASHLLPLLLNNGEAAKKLFKEAETGGLIISNEQIQQAKEFDRQWKLLGGQVNNFKNLVAIGLTPAMTELVGWIKVAVGWFDRFLGISNAAKIKKINDEIDSLKENIANGFGQMAINLGGEDSGADVSALIERRIENAKDQIIRLEKQKSEIEAEMAKISQEIADPRKNTPLEGGSENKPYTLPEAMLEDMFKQGKKAGQSFMMGFGEQLGDDDSFATSISTGISGDGESLMERLTRERELILEFQELEIGDAEAHAQALAEIDRQMTEEKKKNTMEMLSASESLFDSLAGITKTFAGEQSSAYKMMFATSKGFQLAQASLNLYGAIMSAYNAPDAITLPQKLAYAGTIASAAGGVLSSLQGISYGGGRETGGLVSSGSYYQMGENNKPEILQTGSGMFVVPGDNGRVFNQNQLEQINGGGSMINLNVYTSGSGDQVSMKQDGNNFNLFVGELVNQMDNKTGPFTAGLKRNFLLKDNLAG